MAAFAHGTPGSASANQRDYDPAGIVRPDAGAEKSCDSFELGSFSRGPGVGAALRGEFFLPGLPVHAGTQRGTAIF